MINENFSKNSLIGFAVGDAFGVPTEFLSREEVQKINLKDMVGCEDSLPFKSWWGKMIPSGAWSDDTSMLIAAMDSIIKNNGKIDYNNIMQNFIDWWYHGKYTSFGKAFGLGGTVEEALERYQNGCPALECGGKEIMDNGNGALMRILPFSLYAVKMQMSEQETADLIGKASSITHGHEISKMGCFIYTEFLRNLSITCNALHSYHHILKIHYDNYFSQETISTYAKIMSPEFLTIKDTEISEDNGYVVVTLESVLYSVLTTSSYETALLKSVNMGYDTDTIAGITGSIAGILYGYQTIPERWLSKLRKRSELENLAENFELLFND